jgi:hypothetical protein
MIAGMRDVVAAVHAIVESERQRLDAALAAAGHNDPLGHVLPFFTNNIDVDMYPVIMIDQQRQEHSWVALPDVLRGAYELSIWVMVHHDEPAVQAEALGRLAEAVAEILNRRHVAQKTPGGAWIYFDDLCPVKRIDFGASAMGNSLIATSQLQFASHATAQASPPEGL